MGSWVKKNNHVGSWVPLLVGPKKSLGLLLLVSSLAGFSELTKIFHVFPWNGEVHSKIRMLKGVCKVMFHDLKVPTHLDYAAFLKDYLR